MARKRVQFQVPESFRRVTVFKREGQMLSLASWLVPRFWQQMVRKKTGFGSATVSGTSWRSHLRRGRSDMGKRGGLFLVWTPRRGVRRLVGGCLAETSLPGDPYLRLVRDHFFDWWCEFG